MTNLITQRKLHYACNPYCSTSIDRERLVEIKKGRVGVEIHGLYLEAGNAQGSDDVLP